MQRNSGGKALTRSCLGCSRAIQGWMKQSGTQRTVGVRPETSQGCAGCCNSVSLHPHGNREPREVVKEAGLFQGFHWKLTCRGECKAARGVFQLSCMQRDWLSGSIRMAMQTLTFKNSANLDGQKQANAGKSEGLQYQLKAAVLTLTCQSPRKVCEGEPKLPSMHSVPRNILPNENVIVYNPS